MASGALNGASFQVDLSNFVKNLGITADTAARRIALDVYARITKKTPVDTGRARAGWQITVNEPGTYVPPEGSNTPAAIPALNNLIGNKIYIINNVSYIVYLEEGSSKQAPAGMVRVTLAEVKTELEAIIKANGSNP